MILCHVRVVSRNIVPQSYGGERYEHEVQSIQEGPVRFNDIEEESGEEDGEKQVDGAHQGQVDQPHLQLGISMK